LKARLGDLQANGQVVLDYSGELIATPGVYGRAAACIIVIGESLKATVENVTASLDACGSINGAIKLE
jgi:hypothetical protein